MLSSSSTAWVAPDILQPVAMLSDKLCIEIVESPKSEFSEQFSANNYNFPDVEDNTSGPLNNAGKADLSLLRTPLSICQRSGVLSL